MHVINDHTNDLGFQTQDIIQDAVQNARIGVVSSFSFFVCKLREYFTKKISLFIYHSVNFITKL